MKNILSILFLILFLNSKSQEHWAMNMGGIDNDEAYSTAVDSLGNIYTTGYFSGTVDFDPGSMVFNLNAISSDIFIQKLDSNGLFIWAKKIGGDGIDAGTFIEIGDSGSIYITGVYEKIVDFDPSAGVKIDTAKGGTDLFILKLSTSGNLVWVRTIGGAGNEVSFAIKKNKLSDIYLTGHFEGNVDFNPNKDTLLLKSIGKEDIFVLKLDSKGEFKWAKQIGGTNTDVAYSLFVDDSDCVFFTGKFGFYVDFDPSDSSFSLSSIKGSSFVEKINAQGDFLWVKQFGSQSLSTGYFVKSDKEGNIYITGNYTNQADFNPDSVIYNVNSKGKLDAYLLKLDSMGKFIWLKTIGGTGNDEGYCLAINSSSEIFLAGTFEGLIDIDPGMSDSFRTSYGKRDIFIVHLDKNGNYIWSKTMGGMIDDYCYSLNIDINNNIITSGSFKDSMYCEPKVGVDNLGSYGLSDIFIQKNFAKLNPKIKVSPINNLNQLQFSVNPNPFNDRLKIEFNQTIIKGSLILYNLQGEKVFESDFSNCNKVDLVNELQKGIYVLEIHTGERIERRKVMRE